MSITGETRRESYRANKERAFAIKVDVLEALKEEYPGCITAEEVSERAQCSLNSARSRLTELKIEGQARAATKVLNKRGDRNIAAWQYVPSAQENA